VRWRCGSGRRVAEAFLEHEVLGALGEALGDDLGAERVRVLVYKPEHLRPTPATRNDSSYADSSAGGALFRLDLWVTSEARTDTARYQPEPPVSC